MPRVLHWGTNAFNGLAEVWELLPADPQVEADLREMGIWDTGLTRESARERWVRF